jgi:hypothetical protein
MGDPNIKITKVHHFQGPKIHLNYNIEKKYWNKIISCVYHLP